ncbi:MAG: EAL domain-containing protein [Firmicutes bacterium]|nr:EAL domain-containing protein [Bacillota bacterium]
MKRRCIMKDSDIMKIKEKLDKNIKKNQNLKGKVKLATKVFENAIEGIVITDKNAFIEWANPAFTKITGYTVKEAIGEKPSILKSNKHNKDFYKKMWDALINEGKWAGEIWNRRRSGEAYPEWLTIMAVKDEYGNTTKYISVFNDLTKLKRNEDDLNYKTYYDALTGLPNRLLYTDRLKDSIHIAKENDNKLAVMFLDIDDFKKVNEGLGHIIGDVLLKKVAKRLNSVVKKGNTVARMSGDEFMIMCPNYKNEQAIINEVNKILKVFNDPFDVEEHKVYITASIGISLYPEDGTDSNLLIKNAHSAMYKSKEYSGKKYTWYRPNMNKKAEERLVLENDMQDALINEEFSLYYQPKVDSKTNKIVSLEALIRWNHPTKGMISPGAFIPVAEESGFILLLGEWILKKACKDIKEINKKVKSKITVSVNLSAKQFESDNILNTVDLAINNAEIKTNLLDLEVTETTAMKNERNAFKIMNEMKKRGMTLSIDDFGTGYSSLNYLKRVPSNTIKIDKSFIDNIAIKKCDATIVKSLITMCHSLGKNVVAEGVETKEQLEMLKEFGCNQIQGYIYAPPLPLEEIKEMIIKQE